MDESGLATFIGEKIVCYEERKGRRHISKWSTFVNGKDGFLYGIPCEAHRVLKFNPVDKSMEMIGPDLGGKTSWYCGVLAKNGCIYCPPFAFNDSDGMKMLKINTQDGTVVTFDTEPGKWRSGALVGDDCIYYMPWGFMENHVLRVDPHTDTLSYIRVPRSTFVGTVLGKDNFIYGLAETDVDPEDCVMRFDPMDPESISHFGIDEEAFDDLSDFNHTFSSDGVLGNDGHIYALNNTKQVLKIDTSERKVSYIGKELEWNLDFSQPILGLDQCIYWPLGNLDSRVLKFDPATQQPPSFVVCWGDCGWVGGALASDGVIYCAPSDANYVLAIDPLRELSMTMKKMIRSYPDEIGRLFVQNNEPYSESLFESAVRKFGFARALRLLDECLPSDNEWAESQSSFDSVPLFVQSASGGKKRKRSSDNVPATSGGNVGDVPLSVIYHLVRRNVHGLLRL
jgi:outer membrane protein assembly factor BamB